MEMSLIKTALEEGQFDGNEFVCPACACEPEGAECMTCGKTRGARFDLAELMRLLLTPGKHVQERWLLEAALDNGAFAGKLFTCPACGAYAEDSLYACTTCWGHPGTVFRVEDAVRQLLDEL